MPETFLLESLGKEGGICAQGAREMLSKEPGSQNRAGVGWGKFWLDRSVEREEGRGSEAREGWKSRCILYMYETNRACATIPKAQEHFVYPHVLCAVLIH